MTDTHAEETAEAIARTATIGPCPDCRASPYACRPTKCSRQAESERQDRADEAWFRRHPEAGERIRRTSVAEQVRAFRYTGTVLGEYKFLLKCESRNRDGSPNIGWLWDTGDSPDDAPAWRR